jgi:gamma-glutamyltranspeptidase / glutathione hydrolase
MRLVLIATLAALLATVALFPPVAPAQVATPPKTPVAEGTGGAAATVDPIATQAAIDVLRSGGNAVDATVAAAGVLGVVEPFSCGIGGGGFMVVYDAKRRRVDTIDSRETAPAAVRPNTFNGMSQPPAEDPRVGGLSVGVPGTVAGWEEALDRYGTRSLRELLRPGIRAAREGFAVDETFSAQTESNREIFDDFTSTREIYLTPAGTAPPPGSIHRNPDLAHTYRRIARNPDAFYEGRIARDIVRTVQSPPEAPDSDRPHDVRPGLMTENDLEDYDAPRRKPTEVDYRGVQVFGMGPPSSGGSTVGEALNILEGFTPLGATRDQALHRYLEASKLSFADRGAFLGDPDFVRVPLRGLLSDGFAAERRALIGERALPAPQPAGDPWPYNHGGDGKAATSRAREGKSTTHLTIADRFGNVVSYTFTIEQTGGSGIVVPGRGFLLNNELTDFDFAENRPNSPAGGKRPRSSMSPTIVFDDGAPIVALGSPGGSMIITTVLQILVNHLDFGQDLPSALAAPRASQRNGATTSAESAFIAADGALLKVRGHTFADPPPAEIGAATGIRFLPDGRQQSVAEPTRRGGGSAMVVRPPG